MRQYIIAKTLAYQLATLIIAGSMLAIGALAMESYYATRDLIEQESGR